MLQQAPLVLCGPMPSLWSMQSPMMLKVGAAMKRRNSLPCSVHPTSAYVIYQDQHCVNCTDIPTLCITAVSMFPKDKLGRDLPVQSYKVRQD